MTMPDEEGARTYLDIAAALDRHLPGTLAAVRREPSAPRSAAALVREAGRLLGALPGGLPVERAGFLIGQVRALEATARRLAGQRLGFVDEALATFDLRIGQGDEDDYLAAHRELGALLPGSAPLADRLGAYRAREPVPPGRLGVAVRALSDALRERTSAVVGLPAGETVGYRLVGNAPWGALHHYAGGYRSVVTINVDGGVTPARLARLVAHEVYPGHHTERCSKEAGLVARGWVEHGAVLTGSPQSALAEGAAEIGLRAVVGPGWGRWLQDVLASVGVACDGALAEQVTVATARLAPVRLDAALMAHSQAASSADVGAHLRRWALLDERRVAQVLQFLRHPLWRAYTAASVAGPALVSRWWDARPGAERLRRLLNEPLTPSDLRHELTAERVTPVAEVATNGNRTATSGRPLC
ncbi:MAG TPA: DUF885 domain-containing protein [Pseudonocardia sp.]